MKRRITLFAKGNLDLRDSLHAYRGGQGGWNGVNEILRARFPGWLARVRHETWTRSDALLEARGSVPDGLAREGLSLLLGPYPAASQFSRAVFEDRGADVVVLSVQPDVTATLVRHGREGYLFFPYGCEHWPPADRRWLRDGFVPCGLLGPEESMRNLERIVAALRDRPVPPRILVYNLSSVVPGEWVHSHEGLADTLSTRIRRFNLGLTELSRRTGVSVVDVDAVVARAGADRVKTDAVHLTAEGCRLVAEEVVQVLDQLGCFAEDEG